MTIEMKIILYYGHIFFFSFNKTSMSETSIIWPIRVSMHFKVNMKSNLTILVFMEDCSIHQMIYLCTLLLLLF